MALALRAGRTEIVLIEFPNWPLGPPVAEAIDTMVESLEQLGYTPLVHFQRADPGSLALAGQRVHPVGVIAPGPALSPEVAARLRGLGARGLIAFANRPLAHVYTYVINQGRMGCLAVEHLATRGHRTRARPDARRTDRSAAWPTSGWRGRGERRGARCRACARRTPRYDERRSDASSLRSSSGLTAPPASTLSTTSWPWSRSTLLRDLGVAIPGRYGADRLRRQPRRRAIAPSPDDHALRRARPLAGYRRRPARDDLAARRSASRRSRPSRPCVAGQTQPERRSPPFA